MKPQLSIYPVYYKHRSKSNVCKRDTASFVRRLFFLWIWIGNKCTIFLWTHNNKFVLHWKHKICVNVCDRYVNYFENYLVSCFYFITAKKNKWILCFYQKKSLYNFLVEVSHINRGIFCFKSSSFSSKPRFRTPSGWRQTAWCSFI